MSLHLTDLLEPGGHITSGLILEHDGLYLFAVEPRFQWTQQNSHWTLRYIGIGGHQDPGETWAETVTREALEEAGCRIELMDAGPTQECLLDGRLQPLALVWNEPVRPWFVWRDCFDLPNRHGSGTVSVPFLGLAFRARAILPLAPGAEIPALLGLRPAQITRSLTHSTTLDQLLAEGARLWEAELIPREATLRPTGTARFFAALLARYSPPDPGLKPVPGGL